MNTLKRVLFVFGAYATTVVILDKLSKKNRFEDYLREIRVARKAFAEKNGVDPRLVMIVGKSGKAILNREVHPLIEMRVYNNEMDVKVADGLLIGE